MCHPREDKAHKLSICNSKQLCGERGSAATVRVFLATAHLSTADLERERESGDDVTQAEPCAFIRI